MKMRARGAGRNLVIAGTVSGLLFCAAVCRKTGTGAEGASADVAQKRGRIVLEVEGMAFTTSDFDAYVRLTMGGKSDRLESAALSRLFDDFVEEKILLKRAQSRELTLTDAEKSGYLAKLREAVEADDNPAGMPSVPDDILFERLLVEKYLATVVKDIAVDAREIAVEYNAHKSDFLQPEKVQVSQILLPTEGEASTVREKLVGAGEEEFRRLARLESAGPESIKGGVMGTFSAGQLPQDLERFIFPLKEGEISRVVVSTYGFHIFRVDKKIDSRLESLEDATPAIRARLLDVKSKAAVATHLEDLKMALAWKTYPENLPFPYQRISP
jgi:parvulin-like peptidyl-prolyl isomerase